MKKYLIILLCLVGLSGCIPYLFPLCDNEETADNIFIISKHKNFDKSLIEKILLLDENAIENINFQSEREFTSLMKKNGLTCEKNTCFLFFTNHHYRNISDIKKLQKDNKYAYLYDITLEYNSFFSSISMKENFYFEVEYIFSPISNQVEVQWSNRHHNYISDEKRKEILSKIKIINLDINNFHPFSFYDPKDTCERTSEAVKTSDLIKSINRIKLITE